MKNPRNRGLAPVKDVDATQGGMPSSINESQTAVDVIADYGKDGSLMPRMIEWSNGKKWPIDKITAVGAHPGGQFLRFTCQVKKQWMYVLLPAQLVS